MLYEHALRCFCKLCGSLLNWDCPTDISYTEAECCGLHYRLQPWTVKVTIEDVSSRPILPKMEGSNYSDPEYKLDDKLVGDNKVEEVVSRPLSAAQQELNWAMPKAKPLPPQRITSLPKPEPAPSVEPEPAPKKPKQRKCGICRKPGHDRRRCPDA